jgi:DNA mismatch repair protein MutL
MSRKQIRILDTISIDRIAAGEVIERPSSVVKELIENSLDAGAAKIHISIIEGGITSISIEDDGHGIPFRELPLVFERHATSKIISAADITQVDSFGFRGEAMASIASVSRCSVTSRTEDEEIGGMMAVCGGTTQRREPASRNRGTTILVEDLFFNTPARRKYLKTPAAEKKAIINIVTSIAIAYPEVRFKLTADSAPVIDLLVADSLPARIKDLLGGPASEHLSRFEAEQGGIAVGGMASRPTWTRPNRTQQFIYINRRPVKSPLLSQAIATAYKEVIPPGRHPLVVLFLQIPASEVDINVHPAKTEVRLLLERTVFSLINSALRDGLNLREIAPLADTFNHQPTDSTNLESIANAQNDYLKTHFGNKYSADTRSNSQPGLFDSTSSSLVNTQPSISEDQQLRSAPFWQLHRTYICTQIKGALVIIDQHNSHERILYNEAQSSLSEGSFSIPIQQLLFPVHLELSPAQIQVFQTNQDQLVKLGFVAEAFGGQSIIIQGIPSSVKNWAEGQLLLDILDDISETEQSANEDSNDLLASFACHGAIRAGQLLTVPEMQNLVDKLFATDIPLSCPHGRPTLIQFTIEELEKRFGRR